MSSSSSSREPIGGVVELEQPLGVERPDRAHGGCLERRARRIGVELRGVDRRARLTQLGAQRERSHEQTFHRVASCHRAVARALGLTDQVDLGAWVGVVLEPALHAEPLGAHGGEEIPPVGCPRRLHDARHGADREAGVAPAHLEAALDEDDPEATVAAQARLGELAVARLEHLEREECIGEQHRPQRKHRHRLPRHPHHATGAQAVTFVDRATTEGQTPTVSEAMYPDDGLPVTDASCRSWPSLNTLSVSSEVRDRLDTLALVAVGGEHHVAHVLGQREL